MNRPEREFNEAREARYEALSKKHGPGPLPLLEKLDAALAWNLREHDLVRQQRSELLSDGLITEGEYAVLASEHGGVQRLEDYDRLRASLNAALAVVEVLRETERTALPTVACDCIDCTAHRKLQAALSEFDRRTA